MEFGKTIGILVLVLGILSCGCTTTQHEETAPITPAAETTPAIPPQEEPTTSEPEHEVSQKTQEPAQDEANLSFADKMKIIQKRIDSQPPVVMKIGTTTDIYLEENPTTGYSWNATVTSGLAIINDTYTAPQEGLPGAGGEHHWTIEATATGEQAFSAVYKRPWENSTPDDASYTEPFTVTE